MNNVMSVEQPVFSSLTISTRLSLSSLFYKMSQHCIQLNGICVYFEDQRSLLLGGVDLRCWNVDTSHELICVEILTCILNFCSGRDQTPILTLQCRLCRMVQQHLSDAFLQSLLPFRCYYSPQTSVVFEALLHPPYNKPVEKAVLNFLLFLFMTLLFSTSPAAPSLLQRPSNLPDEAGNVRLVSLTEAAFQQTEYSWDMSFPRPQILFLPDLTWSVHDGSEAYLQNLPSGAGKCRFFAFSSGFLQFFPFTLISRRGFGLHATYLNGIHNVFGGWQRLASGGHRNMFQGFSQRVARGTPTCSHGCPQ